VLSDDALSVDVVAAELSVVAVLSELVVLELPQATSDIAIAAQRHNDKIFFFI
jgi:hypothetical protein